ncbi:MAG: T9SS type A sorting domain-containing protein, partial [Bacteroidales bacterium]|nr:T9SS type A sorting domain-containing protein [Bacteroidales bacterium]
SPAGFSHGEGKLLSPIQSLGTGNCSRMMDGLQPGTAYTAYVRTWCEYLENFSEWERVDFTTTGVNPNDTADHDTTSIAPLAQQRVSIVPNPATNSVTVTAESKILSVEVYNVKGQRIVTAEGRGTTQKLDTSAWPNGTSTVTIRTIQGSVTRKLVIKK